MNALVRGRQAIWGIKVSSGDTFAAGIIKSQKRALNADTDEVFDDDGFTIAQAFFNNNDECDIEIICESGTTEPEPGDDIQIVGIDGIVQNSSVNWDQKGWKSLQVKAKKFANLVEA
jgi:hypothetical protein